MGIVYIAVKEKVKSIVRPVRELFKDKIKLRDIFYKVIKLL